MTLTQMLHFQTICRFNSFTKAAQALYISQPALSLSIKKLEEDAGMTLFQSDVRGPVLTREGKVMLREVNRILSQYQEMLSTLQETGKGRSYLRIGLSSILSNTVFPSLWGEFIRQYPDVRIYSQETSIKELFHQLDTGRFDLIITVFPQDMDRSPYHHYPLSPCENLLFCVHCTHPLAHRNSVTWEEMAKERLILLSKRFNQTQTILQEFKLRGLSPAVIHHAEQIYSVERFVEENAACGFLPEGTVRKNPKIAGVPYGEPDQRLVELIWKETPYPADCLENFIRIGKTLYPHSANPSAMN